MSISTAGSRSGLAASTAPASSSRASILRLMPQMELTGDWDGVAEVTLEAAKRLEAAGADGRDHHLEHGTQGL